MSKEILFGQECLLTQINQFVGHRVELATQDNNIEYQYQVFNWEIQDDMLILLDETELDCKTHIPLKEIHLIKNIDNEDMYSDVITIEYGSSQLDMCCAELRPIPIKCDKCGYIFKERDMKWKINQQGEYGSICDGEYIHKILCDSCMQIIMNSLNLENGVDNNE